MMSSLLLKRWLEIKAHIARIAEQEKRDPSSVTFIAVTKRVSSSEIEVLLDAGHRIFGENRVQEAQSKWPELKARYPDIELHMLGTLQSNKVKEARQLFDVIQTVDRTSLAEALHRQSSVPRLFVQVNLGREPQKGGILPEDVANHIPLWRENYGLPIEGLMGIPPVDRIPAPYFALLRRLAESQGLSQISMGMSGDYGQAIRLGATHVRIGTALFGERLPKVDVQNT
jgi:pyridoxal phosphate enzyme (YggS family)